MKTSCNIQTKISVQDINALHALAQQAGLTLSAWIAEAVREKAEREGVEMTPPRKWGRPKKTE